jgi:hypothetical protein
MPVREDLVERMVKALAAALARMMGLRARGEPAAAREEADATLASLGVDPRLLDAADPALLASMLDPHRLAAAGRLLEARALAELDAGEPARAEATRAKGVALLLEAARTGTLDAEAREALRRLVAAAVPGPGR